MSETKTFDIAIIRKRGKKTVKKYALPFKDAFEAMDWGEKQAAEFGADHYAELISMKG